MSWTVVLFPDPLGPTKAVVSPCLICMLRSSNIWRKSTCSKTNQIHFLWREKWIQRNALLRYVPWPQAGMGKRKRRYGTQCHLWRCPVCDLLQTNNQSLAPVNMKIELDNTSYKNAAVTDLVYIWTEDLTLSIVSKIDLAAARPEAKASRQGDAWPRFIAAMSTPKKTWKNQKPNSVYPKYLKNNSRTGNNLIRHTWIRPPGDSSFVSMTNLDPYQKANA